MVNLNLTIDFSNIKMDVTPSCPSLAAIFFFLCQ